MINYIEQRLDAFLHDENMNVILMSGDWGSGKTYFLREYIKDKKGKGFPQDIKYISRTSLFGVSTKVEIYNNIISSKTDLLGKELKTDKYFSGFLENIKRVRAFGFSLDASNILGLFKPKNSLLCFDDFERIGSDEKLALHFIGLVADLKENSNCKIIIVSNTKKADQGIIKLYNDYKEKIIDDEIEFSQDFGEIVNNMFSSESHIESIRKLGINNIRTLKKIKIKLNILSNFLKNTHNGLKEKIEKYLILAVWSHYENTENSNEGDIISEKFIISFGGDILGRHFERKKYSVNEKRWEHLLYKYSLPSLNDLEAEIFNFIKKGFANEKFLEALKKEEISFNAGDYGGRISKIWDEYFHGSLKDNENEFIDELLKCSNEGIKYLGINDINQIYKTFKEYGVKKDGDQLLTAFIDSRSNEEKKLEFNLEDYRTLDHVHEIDDDLKDKLIQAYKDSFGQKSLLHVMNDAKGNYSIDENYIEVVYESTEEQFVELFKNANTEDLKSYRYILFKEKNTGKKWDNTKLQAAKAIESFSESKIHKKRLDAWGVTKILQGE